MIGTALQVEAFPGRLAPMLASSSAPFDDPRCLFEIKWDGVRMMASKDRGRWSFWGRDMQDYTPRYPEIAAALDLPDKTILDGELVALRDGRPDFHALMGEHRGRSGRRLIARALVRYVVFDLPYLGGRSLLRAPLAERRELLREILPTSAIVECCQGAVRDGKALFRKAIHEGHEGVVAKRLTSFYAPGKRSPAWQKIKQPMELPCVVIGYRADANGLRDLLLATLQNGALAFVGVVELGIPEQAAFLRRLESRQRRQPAIACHQTRARWVEPEFFCVVRFFGWRPSGAWRDPVFLRWG